MKQILFSRTFPSYHPRKGEPTYFVEKMMKWYMEHTDTMKDLNIPAYYEATKSDIDTNLFDSLELDRMHIEMQREALKLHLKKRNPNL